VSPVIMARAARSLHSTRANSRRPVCASAQRRDVLVGTLGMGATSATIAGRPIPSLETQSSSPIPEVAKRVLAGELQVSEVIFPDVDCSQDGMDVARPSFDLW
jgi:hypothetical protein